MVQLQAMGSCKVMMRMCSRDLERVREIRGRVPEHLLMKSELPGQEHSRTGVQGQWSRRGQRPQITPRLRKSALFIAPAHHDVVWTSGSRTRDSTKTP